MQSSESSILSLFPLPARWAHLDVRVELGDEPVRLSSSPRTDVLMAQIRQVLAPAFRSRWESLHQGNPGVQLILYAPDATDLAKHLELHRRFPLFYVIQNLEDPEIEKALIGAVEKSRWTAQNAQLEKLVADQFNLLKALSFDLEDRVQKRQRFLEESRRKNLIAQFRWQTLRKASEEIQSAESIAEIEQKLSAVLQDSLNLLRARLILEHQSSLGAIEADTDRWAVHKVSLFNDSETPAGFALYFRDSHLPFSADEKDFLSKITESVALAIRRFQQLELSSALREQWQATFNAVQDPIALITSDYEVLQANSAFNGGRLGKGGKCFEILFQRTTPCNHCHLGQQFRLDQHSPQLQNWEVSSSRIPNIEGSPTSAREVFVNHYHNITEKLRWEHRLLQSGKLAELGIIGSSIAHELNNPLGGMLSFVQMMKMDLEPSDPLRTDFDDMEQGVLRCRDIVQNLLGFARHSPTEKPVLIDLREPLKAALHLLAPRCKAHGVQLRSEITDTPVPLEGHPHLISQALANVLHHSFESARQVTSPHTGIMEVHLRPNEIIVLDNGPGTELAPSLTIPMAQQIFLDHHAQLEVSRSKGGLRTLRISLPQPEPTRSE